MSYFKTLSLTLLVSVYGQSGVAEELVGIKFNKFGERTFHHLFLEINKDVLRSAPTGNNTGLEYQFSDGGMFEIFIEPPLANISHPQCNLITVRMPWTDNLLENAADFVSEKRNTFDEIMAVKNGVLNSTQVVLQLDPYFEIDDGTPRLTRCTVFFRQAFGRYIDNVEPISR